MTSSKCTKCMGFGSYLDPFQCKGVKCELCNGKGFVQDYATAEKVDEFVKHKLSVMETAETPVVKMPTPPKAPVMPSSPFLDEYKSVRECLKAVYRKSFNYEKLVNENQALKTENKELKLKLAQAEKENAAKVSNFASEIQAKRDMARVFELSIIEFSNNLKARLGL